MSTLARDTSARPYDAPTMDRTTTPRESRDAAGERGATDHSRIAPLSPLVASQIAAGEVVERPASVVKELIENSIDAGAGRVRVEIDAGGVELVRVSDDGRGMHPDDLPLALAPHATSKVRSASDLDRVATLGFRGEALASISSVSRMSILTRTAEHDQASLIECEGERITPTRPHAGGVGTSVTVRNLFFNTPARRKFLKTEQTERERCTEVFKALALAHPHVGMTLVVDGRVAVELPPEQSPRGRVLGVLGRELESQLVPVQADRFDDARGLALWGLAGLPSLARGTPRGQHIFVNGRAVRDRTIQHAINEAYRGIIEPGRHPTVVLMLEMSPEGVDVNVHPQKAEVRFRDSSMVHGVVLRALRDALRAADLTPTATALRPHPAWAPEGGGMRGDLLGARSALSTGLSATSMESGAGGVIETKFASFFERFRPGEGSLPSSLAGGETAADKSGVPRDGAPAPAPEGAAASRASSGLLQVQQSYVVTQDEEGLVIIDQHALHERAMFEYLLRRVSRGVLESQQLLAPAVVPASREGVDALSGLGPLLARIGVEAEAGGPTTVLVRAFPSFLFDRGVEVSEFMEELLRKAERGELACGAGGESGASALEEALRDVLDMMSCKAAIKAGDRLSDLELHELVRLREAVERSSACPHGRPTSIRLTRRELDRLFGRS